MVEIPDSLHSMFSATVEKHNGSYVIKVPPEEVANDAITPGNSYRIGVLTQVSSSTTTIDRRSSQDQNSQSTTTSKHTPPVKEGEVREVTVESIGDKGDGIAKVEHGYVVIVPDTQPGDEVTVTIEAAQENVAFATVIAND